MNLILEEPQMPVIVRGPIINSVIRQMFQDIEWGELHFLLDGFAARGRLMPR